jgi:NADH-quinone oxidoreductase subunit A
MNAHSLLDYLPIFIMFTIAAGFALFILFLTHRVGPKRKTANKLEAFECGIEGQGNARVPFSIKYFLVAILFVLFDVEVIFMYPWAANFKALGLLGVIEVFSFIAILLVGFYYMVSKGALKWEE